MAVWRTRGYVPDSDEEDDSQAVERADISDPLTSQALSTHDKESGLQPAHVNADLRTGPDTICERGNAEGAKVPQWQVEKDRQEPAHLRKSAARSTDHREGPRITQTSLSKEEDIDELGQGHYELSPAVPSFAISQISAPLVASSDHGISYEDRRLPQSPQQTSILSSPLSSALSSPGEHVRLQRRDLCRSGTAAQSSPSPLIPSTDGLLRTDAPDVPSNNVATILRAITRSPVRPRDGRSFRRRNPIQLHPYVIEGEKFRRIWKDRGLKPVYIPQAQGESTRTIEDESQAPYVRGQDDTQLAGNPPGSPIAGSSPSLSITQVSRSPTSDTHPNLERGPDELPDLAALLRARPVDYDRVGNKRRKTTYGYSKKHKTLPDGKDSDLQKDATVMRQVGASNQALEIPASPPPSASSPLSIASPPHRQGFRIPRQPAGLPTPLTSSEPRQRPTIYISEDEVSNDLDHDDDDAIGFDARSGADSQSPPEEPFEHLQRIQRKIRGVLPASWLKLDLKSQLQKDQRTRANGPDASPKRAPSHRGIAKVVSRPRIRNPSSTNETPIILSDDSSASDASTDSDEPPELNLGGLMESVGPIDKHWNRHARTHNVSDEVVEDNRIDAMLQSSKKGFGGPRRGSEVEVQGRAKQKSKVPHVYQRTRSGHHHQPRITDGFDKAIKKPAKLRPPKLSILDAIEFNESNDSAKLPRYLKIASRTARMRTDKGRHSPTHKTIKLATNADTNDANHCLQEWREGTIQPCAVADRQSQRSPLAPLSGNETFSRDNRALTAQPLRDKSRTGTSPLTTSRAKRRNQPGTLDQIIQRLKFRPKDRQIRKYRFASSRDKRNVSSKSKVSSALQSDNRPRQAMLETMQEDFDESRPEAAFRRNLAGVNRSSGRFVDSDYPPVPFREGQLESFAGPADAHATSKPVSGSATTANIPPKSHRNRKRQPKRVDINSTSYRQSSEPFSFDTAGDIIPEATVGFPRPHSALIGFERFGSQYSVTFDVKPLPKHIYFHHETFIGSGQFYRSIEPLDTQDMDKKRGSLEVESLSGTFHWGQWNEEVSAELEIIVRDVVQSIKMLSNPDTAITATCESAIDAQKHFIDYFSNHLSFIDPIDRIYCVERWTSLLRLVIEELSSSYAAIVNFNSAHKHRSIDMMIQSGTLNLVLTNQLSRVAEHELVPHELSLTLSALKTRMARYVLTLVLQDRLCTFIQCSENFRPVEGAQYSIRDDCAPIQALVICSHLLSDRQKSLLPFWEAINEIYPMTVSGCIDVRYLEKCWRSLFVLLPFLEFNSKGVMETGRRFEVQCDNWGFVKQISSRVIDVYLQAAAHPHPSFNPYCRTLFGRCLHLISDWNWARCESIIGTLFDFFARNNLSNLKNESCHGSPSFLGSLAKKPSLDMVHGDKSFHIFLKVLAKGLLRMRGVYPAKKIRDIIWRLMPNHGRSHPKEEAIRQEDLDALRNHHDLLSTLYWTSPPEFRPRLTVIRNLVNVGSSHREACHLNIRAWSNLVQFQLSTQEEITKLTPFAEWHDDLIAQLLRQHALARSEAEQEVRLSDYNDGLTFNKDMLETTISRNQRQVEAVMIDTLVSLKLALAAVPDFEAARVLLTQAIMPTLGLFSVTRPQANMVVMQTLDVILTYSLQCMRCVRPEQTTDSNDESQDYGDWSFANEDENSPKLPSETGVLAHLQAVAEEPLRHLLSNAFGADTPPEDDLLAKMIDTWTFLASVFVRSGFKCWNDYLGPFGQDSWKSLRATQQTRRFTAYFLARLLETDREAYVGHREYFLQAWIESLVERESLLKFQHRLTCAMLNGDRANPLFANLPFWIDKATGQYDITASDFSLRRLSLISSVLSNMRESIDNGTSAPELKQEYKSLVKQLMNTMKHNYQELGPTSNVCGAYVEFAHHVVEFLQQHTSAICPVDRFFTDSNAFPLPVTDPLYVVGQLKNYGLRLQDPRIPKQLAVFLQSVSERAASEGQQQYLVDQLYAAMSGGFELGDDQRPTLRAFLIKTIIPAYIESGLNSPTGWILLSPFLQALRPVFHDLLNYLDGTSMTSIRAVISIVSAFIESLSAALHRLVDDLDFVEQPHKFHIISEAFLALTALLPTIDYIVRLNGPRIEDIIGRLHYLQSFASFTTTTDNTPDHIIDYPTHETDRTADPYSVIRHFTSQELKTSLNHTWAYHQGRYFLHRGSNPPKEVLIYLCGSLDEEKRRFGEVMEGLFERRRALLAFKSNDDNMKELEGERRKGLGLGELMI